MKTTPINLRSFIIKSFLIFTCTAFMLAGFTKCDAQSITGKWNQVSTKQFLTAEGAKAHGKSVLETQMTTIGTVVFEFKSNHTYILKSSSTLTLTGTWSLSGDQLQMKLDAKQGDPKYNPKSTSASISTISVNGNTMVMGTNYPNSKITSKVEITLVRI